MQPPIAQPIDPHLLALIAGSGAACHVSSLLPDSDLVDQMRDILYVQNEIFSHIIQSKHFGTDSLNKYTNYCHSVVEDAISFRKKNWAQEE